MMQPCKIGTHNGQFHCDEVLSSTFLTCFTEKYQNASIVRTRDLNKLNECDIVIDVGGIYDPNQLKFDHHQITFNEEYEKGNGVRMSSAGLIFKHFGREVIVNVIKMLLNNKQQQTIQYKEEALEQFQREFYKSFVMAIDAKDNGLNQWPNQTEEIQPLYTDGTNLSHRVSMLNPNWIEQNAIQNVEESEQKSIERFYEAIALVKSYILEFLNEIVFVNYPAQLIVEQAFQERKYEQILILSQGCPFLSCFHTIEEEQNKGLLPILYIIFQNTTSKHYYVQSVPQKKGSFALRKQLKKEWNGQNVEELIKLSGIKDIVFCHRSGFLGGAETLNSAIKMAQISIESKE